MSGGHQADLKTWQKVKTRYSWQRMKQNCYDWIASCTICEKKKPGRLYRAELQPIIEYPLEPFQMIGIDFFGPLTQTQNGNKWLLVVTDYRYYYDYY